KGCRQHTPGTCPDGSRTTKYRYNYAHAGQREWKSRFTSVILEATVKKMCELKLFTCLIAAVVIGPGSTMSHAQGQPPPDHPAVTVQGQTYTPRLILARKLGTAEAQTT